MNKREFLEALRRGLADRPAADTEERLIFYSEMIDDRMEEGLSEEEAVSAIGPVEELIAQIRTEAPRTGAAEEPRPSQTPPDAAPKKKEHRGWIVLLAVLGAPLWLPLLIAAAAVVLSVVLAILAALFCLWVGFAALCLCVLGGAAAAVLFLFSGRILPGLALIGAGLAIAGTAILMFFACRALTRGIGKLIRHLTHA